MGFTLCDYGVGAYPTCSRLWADHLSMLASVERCSLHAENQCNLAVLPAKVMTLKRFLLIDTFLAIHVYCPSIREIDKSCLKPHLRR